MAVRFEKYKKMSNEDRDVLIKMFRRAITNTKFKPPLRGWRLLWCRVKWYGYHVPRNLYIRYIGNRFAPK